jgi:MerR family mercuric resistance operon transcriptional regulator
MQPLTIGKVARRAGVEVKTIRFYERQALIIPPPRSATGYRLYPESTIQRLRFIRRAKKLGFSLKEIKELLVLQEDPQATCGDIMARAEHKLADINRRIDDLKKMRDALKILTDACSRDTTSAECPIMQAFVDE